MAASALLGLITDLYKSLTWQQQVVSKQEETVQIFREADPILDMERLTGSTTEEETLLLGDARGILGDLNAQLGQAIRVWNHMAPDRNTQEKLRRQQFPDTLSSHRPAGNSGAPVHLSRRRPEYRDPAVGARARYMQPAGNQTTSQRIQDPRILNLPQVPASSAWWMQERTHYGLCQPQEQGQLETSARFAQSNRAYATPPPPPPPLPAWYPYPTQQVSSQAWPQHPRPRLASLESPGFSEPHVRPARASSEDFWDDPMFDPCFWQKNLRPGNIWIDRPHHPGHRDEPVSPRAVVFPDGTSGAAAPANVQYSGGTLHVGGTDPSGYFVRPGARKKPLRDLATAS